MKPGQSLLISAVLAPFAAAAQTGTLPIVRITTDNATPIVDKVTPIPGSMVVEETDGSLTEPMELTIRGRGNSSWKYSNKKPYKVKFAEKQPLLGMARSRHFAVMKYDDTFASYMALEAMRLLGAPWAAHMVPVEVVLNDSFDGFYYMSETVRVASDRVNITKQADGITDPALIPYGWLVEVDNYYAAYQVTIKEPGMSSLKLTMHSPEVLSDQQRQWITGEFNSIIADLYSNTDCWTERIDLTSVARYFIVREVFHDTDAYHGSLYLYRDHGKWHFGPLWDGMLSEPKTDWVINNHPNYATTHLIKPIMQTPAFWEEVGRLWPVFRNEVMPALFEEIDRMALLCAAADEANQIRWEYANRRTTADKAATLKQALLTASEWMESRLAPYLALDETAIDHDDIEPAYYDLSGKRVNSPVRGIFIEKRGKNVKKLFIR
ncbi:MAG: CotH kinase family protein [Muribaculaceae bacterium]|nr:CotH kinase family protein [Muribaculaceae bacterium]